MLWEQCSMAQMQKQAIRAACKHDPHTGGDVMVLRGNSEKPVRSYDSLLLAVATTKVTKERLINCTDVLQLAHAMGLPTALRVAKAC